MIILIGKLKFPVDITTHLVPGGEPAAVRRPGEGEDVLSVRAALVARRLRVDVPEPHRVVARAGGLIRSLGQWS